MRAVLQTRSQCQCVDIFEPAHRNQRDGRLDYYIHRYIARSRQRARGFGGRFALTSAIKRFD